MPRWYNVILYQLLRAIFWILAKLLTRCEFHRPPNLPTKGPLIVAVNHLHYVDPPLVMLALPLRHVTVLIGEKWASSWPISWLVKMDGGIYVRRGEVDREALRRCLAVLQNGGVLGIAPEGTRSRTGVMQRAKPGIAYLATKANVPIIPVGISGQEKLTAEWKRFRRPHIVVRVGEPFMLPQVQGPHKSEQLQELSDLVMQRIAALVREDLRGVYGGTEKRQAESSV
ncbi:MAG: lysophospholipid acyltransferase family protein [Anaerolineae bacterium]